MGSVVRSRGDLARARDALGSTLTYVVDALGELRVAPRESEHVACAGGGPVMTAGEVTVSARGDVLEASNLSTGFCPDVGSWLALAHALARCGIGAPDVWSTPIVFRRCACGARVIVKEDVLECPECDAELPARWSFDRTRCERIVVEHVVVEHVVVEHASTRWCIDTIEEAAVSDEDRLDVIAGDALLFVVADGAGGTGRGREAAEATVASAVSAGGDLVAHLRDVDVTLAPSGGQAAAALVRIDPRGSTTAALAGDVDVWVRSRGAWRELAEERARKPLLGGGASVTEVRAEDVDALLVASDGLFRYAPSARITQLLDAGDPHLPWMLVNATRLPSGALQDDVAILHARRV